MKYSFIKTTSLGDLYVADPNGRTVQELIEQGVCEYNKQPNFFEDISALEEFSAYAEKRDLLEINHRYAQVYQRGGDS